MRDYAQKSLDPSIPTNQWTKLNKVIYPKLHSNIIENITTDDTKLKRPDQIADTFNKFFINAAISVTKDIASSKDLLEYL